MDSPEKNSISPTEFPSALALLAELPATIALMGLFIIGWTFACALEPGPSIPEPIVLVEVPQ